MESFLISGILSVYSLGLSICVFLILTLANEIVRYLVWPILFLRFLHALIWFFIGAWLGSYLGLFPMYFIGITFALLSTFTQHLFWSRS